MVELSPGGTELFGKSSRRSGTDLETLPGSRSGRETHPEVRNWSGNLPGGPELVGRPSRRSGTRRETIPEVRKWSGDTPGGPDLVS